MLTTETLKDIFNQTYKLVSKGWCQDSFAIRKNGKKARPRGLHATKWCLVGAICRSFAIVLGQTYKINESERHQILKAICDNHSIYASFQSLSEWNDKHGRKKEEVLAVIAMAIANL